MKACLPAACTARIRARVNPLMVSVLSLSHHHLACGMSAAQRCAGGGHWIRVSRPGACRGSCEAQSKIPRARLPQLRLPSMAGCRDLDRGYISAGVPPPFPPHPPPPALQTSSPPPSTHRQQARAYVPPSIRAVYCAGRALRSMRRHALPARGLLHRVPPLLLLAAALLMLAATSDAIRPAPGPDVKPVRTRGEAATTASHGGGGGGEKIVQEEARATGSSLPDCSHACGACSPCSRVMVSFKCSIAEPCPMVYRCMCKGKCYPVPSS